MSATTAFRGFLDQAHQALAGDDAQKAERLAKAVTALVRAEREVTAFLADLQAAQDYDDHEAIRAELHRRLALFVDASVAGCSADKLAQIAATGSDS